jgi:hypothetical protein
VDLLRRDPECFLFFDGIKTATVDHPQRGSLAVWGFLRGLQFAELSVQPGKVVSLADPHDSSKNVEPPHEKLKPFSD